LKILALSHLLELSVEAIPASNGILSAILGGGRRVEVSDVLLYHETAFLGIHLQGEISGYFRAASILPAYWQNRGFFLSP